MQILNNLKNNYYNAYKNKNNIFIVSFIIIAFKFLSKLDNMLNENR